MENITDTTFGIQETNVLCTKNEDTWTVITYINADLFAPEIQVGALCVRHVLTEDTGVALQNAQNLSPLQIASTNPRTLAAEATTKQQLYSTDR